MVLLEKAFAKMDIPIDVIQKRMDGVLPKKYTLDVPSYAQPRRIDKEQLKKEIVAGGSSAYTKLVEGLWEQYKVCGWNGPPYPQLVSHLLDHRVKELYRFVWIWSEDGRIMVSGKSWYTDKERCKAEGQKFRPAYETFDGPGSPTAVLCIEATCPCNVHHPTKVTSENIAAPCKCYLDDCTSKGELCIEGFTILKEPNVSSTDPTTYNYFVVNTGKRFTSSHEDMYVAYKEQKKALPILHTEYDTYEKRLESFHEYEWPECIPVAARDLAQSGFFYKGRADKTTCFACGVTLKRWGNVDVPKEEHKKHSPTCPYMWFGNV
jgi:hypothetical protein